MRFLTTLSRPWRFGLFLILLLPFLALAYASPSKKFLTVTKVINAKSFILEDGRTVRMAGIQAPNIVEKRDGRLLPGEPLGEDAKHTLEALILNKRVRLETGIHPIDRHERTDAQVYDEQGRWIQTELLRQGWVMIYSFSDSQEWIEKMRSVEKEAQVAKRGIWALPYYQVLTPENASCCIGRYRIVEGKVHSVKSGKKGYIFINFGEDWKTDFTLFIGADHVSRFDAKSLVALERKTIRVRGWLHNNNGPMIDLTHPGQIEVVTP